MKTTSLRIVLLALFVSASARAADWWTLSDLDFINQYKSLAVGTQAEQSQFAWMLFARLNQPASQGSETFSTWELWASDPDTFPAPGSPLLEFSAAKHTRLRPQLQESLILKSLQQAGITFNFTAPPVADEEVKRNPISYTYITSHGLNTIAGIGAYFNGHQPGVDFPLGAVEVKAVWTQTSPGAGAYEDSGYYLTGLHIMVKIAPRPSNPYTDDSPSWFWTTFEFKGNPGLSNAQGFITYHDALPAQTSLGLLTDAGLGGTPFPNYVCDGQQIQFSDAVHSAIILGNTQMEGFLGVPRNSPSAHWTNWPTSCHTCHARAGAGMPPRQGQPVSFNRSYMGAGVVGNLTGSNVPPPMPSYQSLDFVWAFARAQ